MVRLLVFSPADAVRFPALAADPQCWLDALLSIVVKPGETMLDALHTMCNTYVVFDYAL